MRELALESEVDISEGHCKIRSEIRTYPDSIIGRSALTRGRAAQGNPVAELPVTRVLVVDDDEVVKHACTEIAASLGYAVESAGSVPNAMAVLKRMPVDVLLLDIKLPGIGGFRLLEEVRKAHPCTAVIMMTAFATIPSVVEAMRSGAEDFLEKPFTVEDLNAVLMRAATRRKIFNDQRMLRERLHEGKAAAGTLLGRNAVMEKVFRMISGLAYTKHPALIVGEPGTGKETVARTIHANGQNSGKPFVAVDCGSLAPFLLEGELFGYAENTIRSGCNAKPGLLTIEGSTVFLNEVGDLPFELQVRLGRALKDRQVMPLGGVIAQPIRARVLAGSSRELPALADEGRFRSDLLQKLNIVKIRLPPLRDRRNDITLLVGHVLERCSRERGVTYSLSDAAFELMLDYEWPGNIAELVTVIEGSCTYSSGPIVHIEDLSMHLQQHRLKILVEEEVQNATQSHVGEGIMPLLEIEKQAIVNALCQLNGDKLQAAKLLGIGKTTLYRKLKEYGVSDES